MNLEHLFYCALSGGLLAYGLGCGGDSRPDSPSINVAGEYSLTTMDNNVLQVYGSTEYEFTVECENTILAIERSPSADAVWFEYDVANNTTNNAQKTVTITPDQDGSWSAKVTFRCTDSSGSSKSTAKVMNFCYNGPCSTENKP